MSVEPTEPQGHSVERLMAELLRRQRGSESLLEFARAIEIPGVPKGNKDGTEIPLEDEMWEPIETSVALHHRVIMAAIQRAMETPFGRLMIFAPPGSAKSTYASVVAPAWKMGKTPGYRVILGSYASEIAVKQSKKCRSIVRQPAYCSIFKETPSLNADSRAADQWALTNGSEFMAAGLLAGVTGNRANCFIIDDPVQNREAADSPTIQDKTYNEFIDTAQTRLLPGGTVIVILTRWHPNDLAGRILPIDYKGQSGDILCQDGQVWTVLNIPAKSEHEDDPLARSIGDYLWPEWFPLKHWAIWENNTRAKRTWAALYQQRPTVGEGLKFTRSMFKRYDPRKAPGLPGGPPIRLNEYGASDYATKDAEEEGDKDFTEHGVAGLDWLGDLYFTDWWSGQRQTDVSIAAFIAIIKRRRVLKWANEGGPIDLAIRPAINKAMREAKRYVTIEKKALIQSKSIKLESFYARCLAGTVYFPFGVGFEWADEVIDQLCDFPVGRHDDKADVCGLIGRMLDDMMDAPVVTPPEEFHLKPFSTKWLEYSEAAARPKVRFVS
jgi:hypothetical protein